MSSLEDHHRQLFRGNTISQTSGDEVPNQLRSRVGTVWLVGIHELIFVALKRKKMVEILPTNYLDIRGDLNLKIVELAKSPTQIPLNKDATCYLQIGSNLRSHSKVS